MLYFTHITFSFFFHHEYLHSEISYTLTIASCRTICRPNVKIAWVRLNWKKCVAVADYGAESTSTHLASYPYQSSKTPRLRPFYPRNINRQAVCIFILIAVDRRLSVCYLFSALWSIVPCILLILSLEVEGAMLTNQLVYDGTSLVS